MTDTRRDWDAIVVGLGAIGSAAAYWLSRSLGDRVLGLERFELDHVNGASADHSRIIRLSYHRPDYVRLAKRAYETWAEVEREAGERIVTVTGGLDLWPADPAIPMADYTDSLAAEAVPFERLDAAEIMRRWPQWRLADDVLGLWQAQGGLADPFRGNAAHRRLARAHGATLRDRAPVTAIRDAGGGDLEVVTPEATYRTGRVVLAADAWTNDLLAPFGRRLPLTITKEQVTYFGCPDPSAFAPGPLPGLDLDGRAVVLRLPDLRRGRPEGRPGLRRPAGRSRPPDVRARRGGVRAGRGLPGGAPAGRARPADLHEDVPLHPDPGSRLRGRSPARPARCRRRAWARHTASSSPRSSAGSWPS